MQATAGGGRCCWSVQAPAGCRAGARLGSRARRRAAAQVAAAAAAAAVSGRDDALLLSFYACQNKGLFAAQCFVETVLDAYMRGETLDELQTSIQLKNMQQNSELLNPTDQDLLLSWIILVMLTARDVGVSAGGQQQPDGQAGTDSSGADAASGISQQYSTQVLGLLQFAKQALKLYFEQGYSVRQLQGLQATVSADAGGGGSQFMQLMQQYTLLVIITLEVIAGCGLATQKQLSNPTSLQAPSGYTAAFCMQQQQQPAGADAAAADASSSSSSLQGSDPSCSAQGLVTATALAAGRGGVRATAVQLLTAFVGAALGVPFAMRSFLVAALDAYSAGVSVPELCEQLQSSEFMQTGGLVPSAPQQDPGTSINQQLFGRWLSIVYAAAAQLNAVFPGAADKPGWAWYGGEDEVQANAMADFVARTLLRLQADTEARQPVLGPEADQVAELDPLAAKIKLDPDAALGLQEASRQLQQEFQEQGTLRGKPVPVMVRVPDEELEATSSAVRVWKQQLDLVEGVYMYIMALQGLPG